MTHRSLFALILCGSLSLTTLAQHPSWEGHWEGAYIQHRSFQRFTAQFIPTDKGLIYLQRNVEWFPQFGEFEGFAEVLDPLQLKVSTAHGKTTLVLDSNHLEARGYAVDSLDTVFIHLKKVADPPFDLRKIDDVNIEHDGLRLAGHLHRPEANPTKTALIVVGGRGCWNAETEYNLYGRELSRYGIAVLAVNKRGTGRSEGDCTTATIDQLADDVSAWVDFLRNLEDRYQHVGVIGSSAGGWTMAKASESTDFDFMISSVGPSTSVYDQQTGSGSEGIEELGLSKAALDELMVYTDLMFKAPANQESFNAFQSMLKKGKENGWTEILDDTDVPKSVAGIDSLWVRRHDYDPDPALRAFNGPFLGIYGGEDWIVPYRANIDRLEQQFAGDRRHLLTTVVTYGGGHSHEVADGFVSLPDGSSYYHFFRVSAQQMMSIVDFLREHEFILSE